MAAPKPTTTTPPPPPPTATATATIPPPSKPLFTVPIPPCDSHPGGSVTVTEPHPRVYLLTVHSPPDNRLTTALCGALLQALDLVELAPGLAPGCVVTASALPKFYSNGLDIAHAVAGGDAFFEASLYALYRRLLAYPMPTVALVGGHAFAGGLMLAMHHDYRVMSPRRGFACLNELEFGSPLKPAMSAVFRAKVPDPRAYRELVLEARRFGGVEAAAAGIVDVAGGWDELVALVDSRGLTGKARTGIYGLLKMEMYRECLDLLDNHAREEAKDAGWVRAEEERKAKGRREVEEWVAQNGKAKL